MKKCEKLNIFVLKEYKLVLFFQQLMMGKRNLVSEKKILIFFLVLFILTLSFRASVIDGSQGNKVINDSPLIKEVNPFFVSNISSHIELNDVIDGGLISYSSYFSSSENVSVWFNEVTDVTSRGSRFLIGMALLNKFLVPGNEVYALVYLKPLSFADENTVDFHDIVFYYRVFDSDGHLLFNDSLDETGFELYLNSGEDHLGLAVFNFTVPTWATIGKSHHEAFVTFREDVTGESDPINYMGWYGLIDADVNPVSGTNTGVKSLMVFSVSYIINWSLNIDPLSSSKYYVSMDGNDYKVTFLSHSVKFLSYNLTELGNDAVGTYTFDNNNHTLFYDFNDYTDTFTPYYSPDNSVTGVVFTGTIDILTNKWISVARTNNIKGFGAGVDLSYSNIGWFEEYVLPLNGLDAFLSDNFLVFLGNVTEYQIGETLGPLKVNNISNQSYLGVDLGITSFQYSSPEKKITYKISKDYGFLTEEEINYSFSETVAQWEIMGFENLKTIITSLKFIDSTRPKLISGTEFFFYEGVLPSITLEIKEKHPKEYFLYRDGLLVRNGEMNSTRFSIFLEVLPAGNYTYRLELVDKMENIGIAYLTLHVLKPRPPTPPQNLMASLQKDGVLLKWQPPKDDGGSPIKEYIIYRRAINESNYSILGNSTFTEYLDLKVSPGESYFYVVIAINAIGSSNPSNEVQITIPITFSQSISNITDEKSSFLTLPSLTIYFFLALTVIIYRLKKSRT